MTETVVLWQCIGCGKLERTESCIGVCTDRKVEMVYAVDHAQALIRIEELESLLSKLVHITPRDGRWEATYRALQAEARKALAEAT
jgi:hypothetical protein